MAEDNLKDFTVNWIIGGLLMFSLLTFAIMFMANNASLGLDDGTSNVFDQKYDTIENRLIATPDDANVLLNNTANTNPEVSDLGSRDSVSTAYGAKKTASANWEDMKEIVAWVFSGDSGKVLLAVIGGVVAFLSMFYIWRFIRGY